MRVHPAATLFPLLTGREYRMLVESIRRDGLVHPIVLDQSGRVLDGRNRLHACEEAKVKPLFVTYKGSDPFEYVVRVNIHRRHLSVDQRAALALALMPKLQRPRGRPKNGAKVHSLKTTEVVSALVGVSARTVAYAKQVETNAPDLASQVKAGKLTYSRAARMLRNREAPPSRRVEGGGKVDIRCGDFRKILIDLQNVDAVICDPPYGRNALPLLSDLAVWADKVLTPDGVLAVMIGQMFLPEVMRQLDGYRPYRWTMACVGTRMQSIYARRVSTAWKPILIYGSGPRINGDLLKYETNELTKDHPHGQDLGIFIQLVERLTKPGQTIADPFMGSGTTLLAAQSVGRNAIGCDIDKSSVVTARRRLRD